MDGTTLRRPRFDGLSLDPPIIVDESAPEAGSGVDRPSIDVVDHLGARPIGGWPCIRR
jgi:hypothetical protein